MRLHGTQRKKINKKIFIKKINNSKQQENYCQCKCLQKCLANFDNDSGKNKMQNLPHKYEHLSSKNNNNK